MGKPLKTVIVGESRNQALRVAADLEQCGYDPTFTFVDSAERLESSLGEGSEIVIAWRATPSLPAERTLHIVGARPSAPSVVVYSETYSEVDIVKLMRAGAADCVRRGDLARLRVAVERELEAERTTPDADSVDEADDRYRALIEEIPALTYVAWADDTGSRAYVSPQLQAMTGFSPGEWLSEPDMWARRLHPEDRHRVLEQFHDACAAGGRFASEYRILDRDDRVLWWRDEGRALPGPDGSARFVRGFVLDVTEQRMAEQSLHRMRYYDQLTGLPNRLLLLHRLGEGLADALSSGGHLALLILALDRFRDIGNILGHHNGDRIVAELAVRLGEVLGAADKVARLRGDEFGILIPDADADLAQQVAGRMLDALEAPFMVQHLPIEVSASVGMAIAPEHGGEAERLLRRADAAVQAARRLGGGASIVYSEEYEPHDPSRLALLGELRQALEANQLELHYQPTVDLRTRTVVGAEALLRWPHARRGLVAPGEFIPLAERTGLMRPLTRWVINQAVQQIGGFGGNGRGLKVAVNVSARNLNDSEIVDEVTDALLTHQMPAERLQIEVTESAVMADAGRAADVLGELKRRGVEVAIDDFGTGYSSLSLLRHLPVGELKIDRSFVKGMDGNGGEDTAIVRSTSDLAHNLGLLVVAEGVEDERTLDALAGMGCDLAQGYHIARPMPIEELVRWLDETPWGVGAS